MKVTSDIKPEVSESKERTLSQLEKKGGNGVFWAWFFNTCFFCFSLGYFPFFLKRLKQAESPKRLIRERWGFLSPEVFARLQGRRVIWVHAVSVGEVISIQKMTESLIKELPGSHILITTVTPTGQTIAKKWESENLTVCYFPFDYSFTAKRFLRQVQPEVVLLVETEIWPNFLSETMKQNIPVGILNARLSKRSRSRYGAFSWVFDKLFKQLNFVLAQTDEDAVRFKELGVEEKRVQVAGNLKFDNAKLAELRPDDLLEIKKSWGIADEDFILIAGSTHPGEEEVILAAYAALEKRDNHRKLVLAPRHVDRAPHIAKLISQYGFTQQTSSQFVRSEPWQVLLIDQMGILKDIYAVADIVLMGGSFVRHGGQNPIEAGSFKKAILHGPHVFNFKKVYQSLNECGGALRIERNSDLEFALKKLCENQSERESLGEASHTMIRREQGATEKHLKVILEHIKSEELEERN